MTKKSADVKQLKLQTRDQLSDMLKQLNSTLSGFVKSGKQAPKDLLTKLGEVKAALRGKSHKYKQFHKATRNKPQMRK